MMNDPTPARRHPVEGELPSPSWAADSALNVDGGSTGHTVELVHTWRAPEVGSVVYAGDDELGCPVELVQEDDVVVEDGRVVLRPGAPFIFLTTADARFTEVAEARAFAAAILACCDRLDGAA